METGGKWTWKQVASEHGNRWQVDKETGGKWTRKQVASEQGNRWQVNKETDGKWTWKQVASGEGNRYVSSATDLSFSWSGFKFDLPVKFYDWAIGTPKSALDSINCASLVHKEQYASAVHNSSHLFDVHPLTGVNLDTYVKESGLNLVQGERYRVVVIATDEAGGCVYTSGVVTVDTTPPLHGHVGVGPEAHLKLLYSSSAVTLTTWWTGFSDPESGVKTLQTRLLSAGDSCIARHGDNMTTVVDWTELSPNSTAYEFTDISLQETETYFVELRVTNSAGLFRSVVSRPVLLDAASPTAGVVKHGDHFTTDITYQSSVSDMHGVFLYLPTASGAGCPQRVYHMTSPDTQWNPLVHKQLRGLNRQKQDGVVFRDFQLSYSEEGLGVTMRRDVRTSQMLSGAIQTVADVNRAAQYSFEIQAASGSLHAVTSVIFLDGPAGVFADYTPVLFDGDTARLTDRGPRSDGVTIIDAGLPGDTSRDLPEGGKGERKGFGFQIHPNTTYQRRVSDWIVLWSSKRNGSMHTVTELDFHPEDASHVYRVVVNGDDPKDVNDYWDFKLFVDGTQRALLAGGTNVSSRTQLTVGVYGRHGWVAPLEDAFNPPETTAFFRNMKFPAPSTDPCRFGDPFRGSSHPITEFLAAVGTTAYAKDVANFQKVTRPCIPCQLQVTRPCIPCQLQVTRPCIPCQLACHQLVCSDTCLAGDTQVVHVNVSGLTLEPLRALISNETRLQPYYLTVKAVTGSGRSVTATSRGIYLDVTPPVIQMMYHVDLAWSQSEPSAFQGDNSSMALYFEVVDPESEVVDTWWAIGSTPGGADVQPFVSVGASSFVTNTSLEGLLQENHTYYVTLVCLNGAGLNTTNSSQGVTILTVSPKTDNMSTSTVGTEAFDNDLTVPAVKTSRQDAVGVAWDKAPAEEHIDGVYFSVGTKNGSDDIYPEQQVGVGDYGGEVTLTADGMKYTGGNMSTLNDTGKSRRKRDVGREFYMEPGRTLRVRLRACSKAHKCSEVPVKPILIVRDTDAVAKTKAGRLALSLTNAQNPTTIVNITAMKTQKEDAMLAGGFLSDRDVSSQYLSAASNTFKTFIVDPESTTDKTDRYLRNRIRHWEGDTIFVTTLPDQSIDGPLSITMSFDKSRVQDFMQDVHPRILRWCADQDMWIDAGRTCDTDPDNRHIDWEHGTVIVKVCHSDTVCSTFDKHDRRKRAVSKPTSEGVGVYALGGVNNAYNNSPPIIQSESDISIFEDQQFTFIITAKDPEKDEVSFLLNLTAPAPMGNASLTLDGTLTYMPCANCYGTDTVYFTVWERRTDGEQPLSVDGTLTINIVGTNDAPNLQMFSEGRDIVPPSSKVAIAVEENNANDAAYQDVMFVVAASDADYDDDVKLAFDPPEHGNLTVYTMVKNVNIIPQDCSQPWHSRRHLWDKLIDAISSSNSIQKVRLPEPCDDDLGQRHLAVVVTVFKYRPFEGYFGEDVIKVSAKDIYSQDLLVIDVNVLRNPCMNQGVCEGPETDPNCTSTNRTKGFDGYSCGCPRGYSGDYCETDIDECLSSPCSANYSCVNRVGGYECFCHPSWPCHVTPPPLASWQVAMLSVGSVLLLVLIALGVVCIYVVKTSSKRSSKVHDIKPTTSSSTSSDLRHGPFRGRWLYGFQSSPQHTALDQRIPPAYGRREDVDPLTADATQTHPHRKLGPRISRPQKPLYRPMGNRIPRPSYD
ncbi:hypothetical protein LSAT2_030719 [Lamellibrachia satsuma]|nr:hypothetical protein LSAT2_030719 [Lamellibrachia satsuma]